MEPKRFRTLPGGLIIPAMLGTFPEPEPKKEKAPMVIGPMVRLMPGGRKAEFESNYGRVIKPVEKR